MIPFKVSGQPLATTKLMEELVIRYLHQSPEIAPLVNEFPTDVGFENKLASHELHHSGRKLLVDVLNEQYGSLQKAGESVNETVSDNIASLLSPSTFTITTGHQLQLAGGPLFFTYKLLTAVQLADKIRQQYPSNTIVPIFWLASEDHDIAEINHFSCAGHNYAWNSNYKGAAGNATCDGMESLWNELGEQLSGKPFAADLIELLRSAYKPTNDLSLATRIFVNRLFGKFGLVVLDANDNRLKAQMKGVFLDDLINHSTYKKVNETLSTTSLLSDPQVKPREINLFYLSQEGRNRIAFENNRYVIVDTEHSFSKDEIIALLNSHPERFSPNVLLRPVYQEKILPNLAYIGGPGELAYWLECKRMFDHYHVAFPLLVLRNNLLQIDLRTQVRMEKLGIDDEQLFMDSDVWIRKFTEKNSELTDPFAGKQEKLDLIYNELSAELTKLDATLEAPVQAELQKAIKGLAQLKEKWMRAEKRKLETSLDQYRRIREHVFPQGNFQERHESLLDYYARFGPDILEAWKSILTPLDGKLTILRETNQ
jgi:bacillithiol biosynthesis cysteine-adding enzyme BshC